MGGEIEIVMSPAAAFRPIAARLLAPALAIAGLDWGEVTARLDSAHARLWIVQADGAPIAAIVTQLTTDDAYEALLAGGSRAREWVPAAVATIRAWARACGAVKCRVWGRAGWQRLLPGWTRVGVEDGLVVLELGLVDGFAPVGS